MEKTLYSLKIGGTRFHPSLIHPYFADELIRPLARISHGLMRNSLVRAAVSMSLLIDTAGLVFCTLHNMRE
jgi:hypothetical protein